MSPETYADSRPLSDFQSLLSPYLMSGYREDDLRIDEVFLAEDRIAARCSVPHYFRPSDGVFHLTVPLAFLAVAQLAIIFAHVDNGLQEKRSEVYIYEIGLKCRRKVQKTRDIGVELILGSKRVLPHGVYYSGSIAVEGRSFTGRGVFLLPRR